MVVEGEEWKGGKWMGEEAELFLKKLFLVVHARSGSREPLLVFTSLEMVVLYNRF